jgi:hypothetical protein
MCDFPARQLLEEAVRVAAIEPDDAGKYVHAYGFLKAINEIMDSHESLYDCRCCHDALIELGMLEPPPISPEAVYV